MSTTASATNSENGATATPEEDEQRVRRPARIDQAARSRSRGRTPSEMLARKQQLLAAAGANSAASPSSPPLSSRLSDGDQLDASQSTAGARLESLSALLRNQNQVAAADEQRQAASLKSIDDVYILLAKKEKDLQLAAELGKVLLERNDELSKANERIAEEYSHKLELLEQEKHKLKRRLDLLDGEYENRIIELQTDCNILKNKLEQQTQSSRQAEKEKSKLIDDLVQQNQRLTSELAEATKSEELLSSQLEQVNERLAGRLSNRSDQAAQVEALQDEIQVLTRRKQDLERRLKLAQNERANLVATIGETGDKVLILENLLNERDLKIGELALEIGELRDSSSWLSVKLESMISLNERLVGGGDNSEDAIEMSERERSHLIEQLKDLRLKRNSRMKANELILAGAAERQRRSLLANSSQLRPHSARRRGSLFSSPPDAHHAEQDDGTGSYSSDLNHGDRSPDLSQATDLTRELFAIFSELHAHLLRRRDQLQGASSAGSSGPATGPNHHNGLVGSDDSGLGAGSEEPAAGVGGEPELEQWRRLVAGLRQLIEEMPCSSCTLMIAERADYEQLQKLHARLCDDVRLKNEELLQSSAKNIEQEARLAALEERCQLLQTDLESCDKPTEEIVRLAWKARDEAVGRKNNAEIQLARTRIENMQVSSQLMEVVQQKGELSQKLAQFEDDIHYMMQRSVRARFSFEEYAEETRQLARGGGANPTGQTAASSIRQLLSLSNIVLMSPKKAGRQPQEDSQGQLPARGDSGDQPQSQPLDSLGAATTNLLANIRSSRFNLKFWQRPNSSQPPEVRT